MRILVLVVLRAVLIATTALTYPAPVAAQGPEPFLLDLASPVVNRTVMPGTEVRVLIANIIPAATYTISQRLQARTIAPLSGPGTYNVMGTDASRDDPLATFRDCNKARSQALERLNSVTREEDIPRQLSELVEDADESCGDLGLREDTHRDPDLAGVVNQGTTMIVRVQRAAVDGYGERVWEFRFSAPDSGEWQVVYGFTFVPNWWEEERFLRPVDSEVDATTSDVSGSQLVASQVSNPSGYAIEEKDVNWGVEFLPSVLYQWVPAASGGRGLHAGFSAGVGANLERIAALAGLSLMYQRNVSVQVGVAIHGVTRGNPRYAVGETVQELLEDGALHETVLRPNLYLGVSFRFGSSPFSQTQAGSPQEGEADAEDSEPKSDELPTKESTSQGPTGGEAEVDTTETPPILRGAAAGDTLGVLILGSSPENGWKLRGEAPAFDGTAENGRPGHSGEVCFSVVAGESPFDWVSKERVRLCGRSPETVDVAIDTSYRFRLGGEVSVPTDSEDVLEVEFEEITPT